MIINHRMKNADLSIATIPVGDREAPEFGILKSDSNNEITSFIEKPAKELLPEWVSDTGKEMQQLGRNYLASMGIYIFSKQLLLDLLKKEKPTATDFGKEIIPACIGSRKVLSYQYGGYWTDIGNIYSFFDANLALTLDLPPFNLFDKDNMVYSRARMLPPAKVSGTILNKTIIAEGSIIKAQSISNSVIGIRSRIGEGSVLDHCYIMGSDFYETITDIHKVISTGIPAAGIGENCYLYRVIADKDVRIGNNVSIKGGSTELMETDLYVIKDGIVVLKKGAVIPNNTVIE